MSESSREAFILLLPPISQPPHLPPLYFCSHSGCNLTTKREMCLAGRSLLVYSFCPLERRSERHSCLSLLFAVSTVVSRFSCLSAFPNTIPFRRTIHPPCRVEKGRLVFHKEGLTITLDGLSFVNTTKSCLDLQQHKAIRGFKLGQREPSLIGMYHQLIQLQPNLSIPTPEIRKPF